MQTRMSAEMGDGRSTSFARGARNVAAVLTAAQAVVVSSNHFCCELPAQGCEEIGAECFKWIGCRKKGKKTHEKKLTVDDIGKPTDFKHINRDEHRKDPDETQVPFEDLDETQVSIKDPDEETLRLKDAEGRVIVGGKKWKWWKKRSVIALPLDPDYTVAVDTPPSEVPKVGVWRKLGKLLRGKRKETSDGEDDKDAPKTLYDLKKARNKVANPFGYNETD